jgi:hypothetical protein
MKINAVLLTLLLVPNLSAQTNKVELKQQQQSMELRKQEEKDSVRLKLALIAAAVTLIVFYKTGGTKDAIEFDKLIMYLWPK